MPRNIKQVFFFFLLSSCTFLPGVAFAQYKTESELVGKLLSSLQHQDSKAFGDLFPGIDSLAQWVVQYADKNSDAYKRMYFLKENPSAMVNMDTAIQGETDRNFYAFTAKAGTLGIHWDHTVFIRFELEKIRRGRGLLTEKIAPLRFLGYIFIKDMFTRKTYTFTVFDIMQVNGLWYGGELVNIFEAATKEEYEEKLIAERKKKRQQQDKKEEGANIAAQATDDSDEDEEKPSNMKEVMDRKYYRGQFDDEIPVQLYVRYIKGGCPEVICSWEALFKFGDQDEYVKMSVARTTDGKWQFSEELGGMELELNGEVYTGTWAADTDKTEYDVELKEVPASAKKAQMLDEILDQGLYAE